MSLRRQLLLVSLLALLLPWAGCEFIRETESALRIGQQQMLTGTARALASSMSQYPADFPDAEFVGEPGAQLFVHELGQAPSIDGYFDDWNIDTAALTTLGGVDGAVDLIVASYGPAAYLYVDVSDDDVVYATPQTRVLDDGPRFADRVTLVSSQPPAVEDRFVFTAEAPGAIVSYKQHDRGFTPEPAVTAHWQDVPGGYRVEARIPLDMLFDRLGVVVSETDDPAQPPVRISSYPQNSPGPIVRQSEQLRTIAAGLVQPGMRLFVTDANGWRIATAGQLPASPRSSSFVGGWSETIYELIVKDGKASSSAAPDVTGRERQPYISAALNGDEAAAWFRSDDSGLAIVAVAAPILHGDDVLGALVLQQGTDAILSLTNESLVRLINLTLIVTLIVAGSLIGYASLLSLRIRRLSLAAENALDNETLQSALPSALADDEIGDLSRSFSSVLRQLGEYNAYLRSLASKLSHELRTPLAIVTSSLENLEHEALDDSAAGYTARAREGADRLRHILSAMSEASRVEELMARAEAEQFDLLKALQSTIDAYRDVYTQRQFDFDCALAAAPAIGSPELLIQMLDKLVDNAVDFSAPGDTVSVSLSRDDANYTIAVSNPGPALPERMRSQMFDSMVSVRSGENTRHLGLGLYVARLIAAGHDGDITAENIETGVRFAVRLPIYDSR